MKRLLLALTIVALADAACGGSGASVGNGPSTATGDSCAQGASCSGGVCAASQDFPSGYCTQACDVGNPASCASDSVCIDDASGAPADSGITALCYKRCTSNADCARAGYACLEKSNQMVCRNGM